LGVWYSVNPAFGKMQAFSDADVAMVKIRDISAGLSVWGSSKTGSVTLGLWLEGLATVISTWVIPTLYPTIYLLPHTHPAFYPNPSPRRQSVLLFIRYSCILGTKDPSNKIKGPGNECYPQGLFVPGKTKGLGYKKTVIWMRQEPMSSAAPGTSSKWPHSLNRAGF